MNPASETKNPLTHLLPNSLQSGSLSSPFETLSM